MFGYFPEDIIVFTAMLEYFSVEKNRTQSDKVFSGSFFASIFKHLVHNLSRNSFCKEKDNVSTSFTFSGLFPF